MQTFGRTHFDHIEHGVWQRGVNIVDVPSESVKYAPARIVVEENHFGPRHSTKDHVVQIDRNSQTHLIE